MSVISLPNPQQVPYHLFAAGAKRKLTLQTICLSVSLCLSRCSSWSVSVFRLGWLVFNQCWRARTLCFSNSWLPRKTICSSGCFQLAFKAVVISAGGKFLSKDKQYVLKQHHLQEYGLIEDCESTSGPSDLSEEFLEQPRIANEKKTTKVTFMYSVILWWIYFSLEFCEG